MRRLVLLLSLLVLAPAARAEVLPAGCSTAPEALARLAADLDAVSTTNGADPPPAGVIAFLGGRATRLGDGWTAAVWGNDDWVVKVIKADVPQASGRAVEPAKRQAMVDYAIWVTDKLRASSRFRDWRDRVPPVFSPGPYALAQRRAKGVWFDQLSPSAKERARAQNATILAAAAAALAGIEWDLNEWNPRNAMYDAEGTLVSWFDPCGAGSWVPGWHDGQPLVKSFWDRASAQIHRRIDGTPFRPTASKFPIGGSYAKKIEGGDLAFGDGLVVANLDAGVDRAFVIRHGFRIAYESTQYPESAGKPLWTLLGAPLDEEHPEGEHVVQHFEGGTLTWNQAEDVRLAK